MTLIQSIILGILQGITEFLPVSSSGHLVLAQKFFNFQTPPILFDALIHLGTIVAVIIYFWKDLLDIFLNLKKKENQKLILFIIIGTIPVVIVGLFLQDSIEKIFNSLFMTGISFLITAVILSATIFIKNPNKNIKKMNWVDALFIGLFQAAAILPGVSRSGSTISSAIFRKIDGQTAFKFSFFLAIPAVLGAVVLQLFDLKNQQIGDGLLIYFAGVMAAIIFGLLALKFLNKVLLEKKFYLFAIYCAVLGAAILLFFH
jgi:undecaprenyl-diphosphatase